MSFVTGMWNRLKVQEEIAKVLTGQTPSTPIVPEDIIDSAGGEGAIPNYESPKNSVIIRRDTPVDIQREDRFSPVNGFAFNPMSQEYMTIDNAVLALILFGMYKKSPDKFASLAGRYMDNVTSILNTIINSAKAHPLSMLNAQTIFACVAHRFGIIDDAHYLKISDQTRNLIDKGIIQQDWFGKGLSGLETLVDITPKAASGIGSIAGVVKALRS